MHAIFFSPEVNVCRKPSALSPVSHTRGLVCGQTVAVMSAPHLNRAIRRGSERGASQTHKHEGVISGPTNTSHDTDITV